MGIYLNPGKDSFAESLNSEIYVDKTGLLSYTNRVLGTKQKCICISRPRRFGKSMAAEMLAAYYSYHADSGELFHTLNISADSSFKKHLNQYDVLFLNMQSFLSRSGEASKMVSYLEAAVLKDMAAEYPELSVTSEEHLSSALEKIYSIHKKGFVIIIDKWDCIFREKKSAKEAQNLYLDFLRDLLKDKVYVKLAYMTGILPIKKYGTHSALNMFDEFSMTNPRQLSDYVGFTETEVAALCQHYNMDFDETRRWYDGYHFRRTGHVYSPKSVVDAISASDQLLADTLDGKCASVAEKIDRIHQEFTSVLSYNDENSLSCVISLTYYSARKYYYVYRETPSGKGFADLIYVPQKQYTDKPALIIELKWDKNVYTAIQQIKERKYTDGLRDYSGEVLLVGINYDKKTKKHECHIEHIEV